jgi:hypothetical protein
VIEDTTIEQPKDNRQKRIEDLNEIISEKEANRPKSIAHVYEPFMERHVFEKRQVPDHVLESCLKDLRKARCVFGVVIGNEAQRKHFVSLILLKVAILARGVGSNERVKIMVEEGVPKGTLNVNGRFDYVFKRGKRIICVVEVKRGDLEKGMP